MVPANRSCTRGIGALLGVHIALGMICVTACLLHDGSVWSRAATLAFLALLGSQMLLVGIVAGISGRPWWQRLLIAGGGLAYLVLLAAAGSWSRNYLPSVTDMIAIGSAVGLPVLIVAGGLLIARRCTGTQVVRVVNPANSLGVPFRFSIRHLLCWTFGFAAALSLASWIHGWNVQVGGQAVIGGIIFGLVLGAASLAIVWLLAWSALGQGNPRAPVLVAIFAAATIGLIPALSLGNRPNAAWPGLTASIAVIVAGSLLVLRGAGFRLVRAAASLHVPDSGLGTLSCASRQTPVIADQAD